MNRKTLTAFGLFVLLGVIALVALRQPEKGESAADRPHPLPKLAANDFDTIEVTKNGSTTTIKNEGGKYKVTAPVSYPADESSAKAAFEAIEKMDVSDLVTEQPAKQAEFEVDDKGGVRLVVKKGATVLADAIIGKTSGAGTMLRLSGQNQVWHATGISRYMFDKLPADWRDKSITTFNTADAERIQVAAKDGSKITVKKSGKEGVEDKWQVVDSSVKIDTLDNGVPNGIVSAMGSWKANDFADGVQLAAAGLTEPTLTITVNLKDNKKATVLIGGKKSDDDLYVKTADSPQIFVVKKYNIERINKRPIEFRDKTLCNIAEADVAEIAVTHGDNSYTVVKNGSDWKATKPAKLEVDASKVTPIAGAFKDWKGTSFAEDQSPKANGLAKPQAVIAVKAKGSGGGKGKNAPAAGSCAIKVGDETKDKLSYFVTTAKGPDVYLAAKWAVDRVLVKVDDIKKAGSTVAKK